jgi:viroplasmin and RNaseH domain-containing protein
MGYKSFSSREAAQEYLDQYSAGVSVITDSPSTPAPDRHNGESRSG